MHSYSTTNKYTKQLTTQRSNMTRDLYNGQGFNIDWRKYHENLIIEGLIQPAGNGVGL